jgi:hypothetical protein
LGCPSRRVELTVAVAREERLPLPLREQSHQRVHQIIDEAAEPTRSLWRRRPQLLKGRPGPCSFCSRSRKECAKLIAGPGVSICERCVADATWLSAHASVEDQAQGPMRLEPPGSEVRCCFCGKEARQVAFAVASALATAPGGKFGQMTQICDECLDLCLAILAEMAPSRAAPGKVPKLSARYRA